MSLYEKTKAIQAHVGITGKHLDGVYGNYTAIAIMQMLGIPLPSASINTPDVVKLVKGTGKNIKRIFYHCSATKEGVDISADTIRDWHKNRGWSDIGYHFIIRLDGTIEVGRSESFVGAHVSGYNTGSIGVVYVGGVDAAGKAKDTRTAAQKVSMAALARELDKVYNSPQHMGHRDASPDLNKDGKITSNEWLKECPCFDVKSWWESIKNG